MITEEYVRQKIKENREFLRSSFVEVDDFKTDQQQELTQPPLCNEVGGGVVYPLTKNFDAVIRQRDYLQLLNERRSLRVFADKPLTLDELAFLLWSTQGVQSVRGRNYCTMRPVPSGGARHPFETYLVVRNIEGLPQGIYHYLPLDHTLEFMRAVENIEERLSESLAGQTWAATAPVTFFYSVVPYRAEWRYSLAAHRVVLLDGGHVVENLYFSAEAIGCGCCAVAAYDQKLSDALLGLDGVEEFAFYAAPVGRKKT